MLIDLHLLLEKNIEGLQYGNAAKWYQQLFDRGLAIWCNKLTNNVRRVHHDWTQSNI